MGIESNALNSLSGYKKIIKQQDMIELLQLAVKEQVEEILRLKEKNKKLTKMVKWSVILWYDFLIQLMICIFFQVYSFFLLLFFYFLLKQTKNH